MYRILLLLFASYALQSVAQSTFHLSCDWLDVEVLINGKVYAIDSMGADIETNYPGFDTLNFLNRGDQDIVCNFKPNRSYVVSGACCGSLDILPIEKKKALLDHYEQIEDIEAEMSNIKEYTLDFPTFSFKLTKNSNDSIFFWSADYACQPRIIHSTNEIQEYGSASKCFYWSNITFLQFYETDDPREFTYGEDGMRYDYLPDFQEVEDRGTIAVRLFDDHHFLVTLNVDTGEIYLRYDD